ncbi:retrotransposon protein, putative, ty1-copia subclass [Tanacetum coccineum]
MCPRAHDKKGTRANVSAPDWFANDWSASEGTKMLLANQSEADTSAPVSPYHMAVDAQNINNMTIRSILLAEKLTGSNFTNWYRNLRIVLRYEKKLKFVEQPIGPAPNPETVDPDTIDKYYETVSLEQEEDGQLVSSYLLKMKSYLDTLERLGYVMPKELNVSLILNSLNKGYDRFVQNYNMHSIRKKIVELHAMLKLHEKGIPKKAETPIVLAIHEGKIQKDKKKPHGAKGKDKGKNKLAYAPKSKIPPPPKRDNLTNGSVCHHCKEGLREIGKLKHGALILYVGNGIRAAVEAIGSFDLVLPTRILNMAPTKKVERTPYEIWHGKAPKSIKCVFVGYPKKTMGYYFYYPLENKIFVARNAAFFENNLMVQEASGSHGLLEAIPSRRSARIPQAPDIYGFYVDVEEHKLGDLDEPPNCKAALSYTESNKWLEAMNTEMQSIKDNQVWYLVDLPPNGRIVGNIRAIRILLAITAFYDYEIWQMGVKTTFLNGYLSEDSCVYLKASRSNVAFLVLYADDILLMGNNVIMLQEVKYWLCKCFSMKDLREATYILGIKIIRDRSKRLIALSQSVYLEKTLKKFRMENSKKGHTLMIEKSDYKKSQGAQTPSEVQCMQRVPYASAIGSIMYAVRCTKPDVAFMQNLCSCFQQNPGEIH